MRTALISARFRFSFMIPNPPPDNLFKDNPIEDLQALIRKGQESQARRLLLLAGKFPVFRIGNELSPPIGVHKLHFEQTQSLAEAMLSLTQKEQLDRDGALEFVWANDGRDYTVNIFFGNGSHNIIIFF